MNKKDIINDIAPQKKDPAITKAVQELEKTPVETVKPAKDVEIEVNYEYFEDPTFVQGKEPDKIYRFVRKDNVENKKRLGYEIVEQTKDVKNYHSSQSSAVEWNENVLMAADKDVVENRREKKRRFVNDMVANNMAETIEKIGRMPGVKFDPKYASDPEYAEFQAREGKRKYY